VSVEEIGPKKGVQSEMNLLREGEFILRRWRREEKCQFLGENRSVGLERGNSCCRWD